MALTETQKNFRKIQKELGNYKRYKRKRNIGVGTGILIFIVASFVYQLPQKLYAEYQIYHHKQIWQYLESTAEYSIFIDLYVFPLGEDLPHVNYQLVKNIQSDYSGYNTMIKELKPVSSFKQHYQSILAYSEGVQLYIKELERIGLTSVYDYQYMKYLAENLDALASQVAIDLEKGFKTENIHYKLKHDGSYEYTIRTHLGEKLAD